MFRIIRFSEWVAMAFVFKISPQITLWRSLLMYSVLAITVTDFLHTSIEELQRDETDRRAGFSSWSPSSNPASRESLALLEPSTLALQGSSGSHRSQVPEL